MQAETGQRRDEYMDWLKGAAILSMVMGHLLTGVPEGAGIFNVIYSFHMPLLFFVSAYVEQAGRDKYADGRWRMLGKRAAGLLLPYVSWSIVYAVYKRSFCSVTLGSLLAALTEYEGNGLWFLLVLFGLKVLHFLYWEICDRIGAGDLWKPLLILAGLESVTAAAALALRMPFLVNMVSYAIPYFAAVLLAEREQVGRCVRNQWVIAAAIAAYVIVFPRFSFYDTGWTTQALRIGLSLCAIVVLWKLREQGTLIWGGDSRQNGAVVRKVFHGNLSAARIFLRQTDQSPRNRVASGAFVRDICGSGCHSGLMRCRCGAA